MSMSDETTNPQQPSEAPSSVEQTQKSDRAAQLALMILFCITSTLGGTILYHGWVNVGVYMAVGRCAVFVAFMAGVHLIGCRLWQQQRVRHQRDNNKSLTRPISPAYWPPVQTALLQQGIIVVLTALTMDGGLIFHVTVIAVLAYWLAFGVILARRPSAPTQGDLFLIRYGFLLLFVIVFIVGPIAWKAMGRL